MESNSNFKPYLLHQSFAKCAIRSSHPFTRFYHEQPRTGKRLSVRQSFFFRCLTVFRGADRCHCNRAAKQLFYDYCTHFDVSEFSGVSLFNFVELENFYKINIVAYELENNKTKVIQRSRELYNETVKVNVFKNHLSLIIDFEKHCHVYQCMHCDKLWYCNCHYYRHTKTCLTTVRKSFPGGIYHNSYTIFEKLEQIGIQVPKQDRFYPYYACYDFEAYLYRD